ncbi:isoleucine--tRNA ligase [Campylobacterota bacterium]|nr:isoleucine--tRNA ligase [Campylobacterota bacterium]GHV58714.1 isoleucine--tRNA ligase [Campylobacterota bacterium]
MQNRTDYKNTLFLPVTNFQMRANLSENEPKRYAKWRSERVYDKMKQTRNDAPKWTFHDGPPYANGEIHIGHALNKILKDIIVKYHYFKGFDVRFTPGWDCHGLPIEHQVVTKLAEKKEVVSKAEIRRLCREHAAKFVQIQKEAFMALGVTADWEKPYITMDYRLEAEIYRELVRVAKSGLLIERRKPVYWSWAAKSALAEAEVEYKDKESDSIFVAFELDAPSLAKLGVDHAKAVIWTTTPWTLPANVAIALKPAENYVLTADGLIVAEMLYDDLRAKSIVRGEKAAHFTSEQLEGLSAVNPLNGNKSLLILGDHVSMDNGTGLVHTAPGHGEDDYRVGLKYDLEVLMSVDEGGCFDATVNPNYLAGMHIFKANELIIEKLGSALISHSKITHSYPHCWRTHKPVIYRATRQWFIAMDKPYASGQTLRSTALEAIRQVHFYPESGQNRLRSMIETRPDWCISRQREWGVPIAFLRHKQTQEVLWDDEVQNRTAEIFEREGCDAWVIRPISDFLGSAKNPDEYEKVMDILDVWFDSGSTQSAVLRSGLYDAGGAPADLYLEGGDQHRGWFQSSLLTSCAAHNDAPFKTIVTHGFTVDENGDKMSKSVGNVVAPAVLLQKYGSEIVRLWVAMSDYSAEVKIGQNILAQVAEQYKKLRNTFRFMLANISDLTAPVAAADLQTIDRWILSEAARVFSEAEAAFAGNDFAKAFHSVNSFVVSELSGVYLDMVKDRIYCDELESVRRRSAQSAIYHILRSLLTLIAPVLTYTADEIMECAPALLQSEGESIFDLTHKPLAPIANPIDSERLIALREEFFASIDQHKKLGTIKNTLELALITESFLGLESEDFADWFSLSSATLEGAKGKEPKDALTALSGGIFVVKSKLHKCPRCWKFVSTDADKPCPRCEKALKNG